MSIIERVSSGQGFFGASLSEPHIDGDVHPTSRGMFVCIWPRGAFVLPMYPRSHVRVNIDRAS